MRDPRPKSLVPPFPSGQHCCLKAERLRKGFYPPTICLLNFNSTSST